MNIADLQATLRQFAADRDWQPFQTPKNLAMAMIVEAAELAEIFQWMTGEQSQQAWRDAAVKQHIGEEVADVLLYLLQIADHTHTDIGQAVQAKLAINARKYAPTHPSTHTPMRQGKAPARAVVAAVAVPVKPKVLEVPVLGTVPALPLMPLMTGLAGQTHVLLDFENVQPTAEQLSALVPGLDHVWLFHGPHQKDPGRRLAGLPVTLVPISKTGKNALDFHLTFYVGYIASRYPGAPIVVVANDRGYEPMLMHARTLGFDVRLQTHTPAAKKAARAPVAKQGVAVKKVAPAKKAAATKLAAPVPKAPRAAKGAPAQKAAKTAGDARAAAAEKTAKAVKAVKPEPAVKPAPAVKPMKPAPAARPSAAAPPPAVQPAPVTEATARQQAVRNLAVKVAAKRPGVQAVAVAPVVAVPPAVPAALQKKLLDNLRKMGDQRPNTQAPLLRALQSYLGAGATLDAARAALAQLAAAGHLTTAANGHVSYRL